MLITVQHIPQSSLVAGVVRHRFQVFSIAVDLCYKVVKAKWTKFLDKAIFK